MWFAAVLMAHLFSQNASGDIVYLLSNNGRLMRPVISSVLYYFIYLFIFYKFHRAAPIVTGCN